MNVIAAGQRRFEVGRVAPEQPPWQTLSPRVSCILGHNPSTFTLNGTNCYLVGTGPKRLLIDAGDAEYGAPEFMASLAACMRAVGCTGLDGIVITHLHHDHYGGVQALLDTYGREVPVYKMRMPMEYFDDGAASLLDGIEARDLERHFLTADRRPQFIPYPFPNGRWAPEPDGVTACRETLPEDLDVSWAPDSIESLGELRRMFYFIYGSVRFIRALQVTGEYNWRPIAHGSVIRTEGATLRCLHTPGHSLDHTAMLLLEEHSIFSGDTVLGFGTTVSGGREEGAGKQGCTREDGVRGWVGG